MDIVEEQVERMFITPDATALIELCGRVCYKSENKITKDSAERFCRRLIKSGHESVLEHAHATFKFITDRGMSHELVRHRIGSFSQESTRYIKYSGIEVIEAELDDAELQKFWEEGVQDSASLYHSLIAKGVPPQDARSVLPTCLKTELVMTANFRQWRHVLKQRLSTHAHPQIQKLMQSVWFLLNDIYPWLVEDIACT